MHREHHKCVEDKRGVTDEVRPTRISGSRSIREQWWKHLTP